MKKVDLLSGETLRSTKAEQRHFGEGLTRWGDQLIQLTWKGPTVLIYNASDLKLMRESKTDLKDGWGLTNDTEHLIATDSGHNLYFLDPDTLTTTRKVPVLPARRPTREKLSPLGRPRPNRWPRVMIVL